MVNSNMKISQKGIELVKEFEGLRLDAYQDAVGVWTIGYGHTQGVYPGMHISQAQAIQYLNEDLHTHASGIFKYITVKLNQNQFDALVSFHFNLGANILQGSDLLDYINRQQWQAAATELKLYNRAGGQVLQGLVRRREAEARLFLENVSTAVNHASDTQYYTIVAGDSLWRIAQLHGLTVDELVRLNGFSSANVVIHPGQKLIVKKGKTPSAPKVSTSPQAAHSSNQIDTLVQWFRERIGVVGYSQQLRQGPHYYDCSSAVYAALIAAGFLPKGTWLGTTGDLYHLEGKLLTRIDRSQARKGDIFLVGEYPGTHTGVFVDNTHIVHCVDEEHGMKETPLAGWVGAGNVYCFRIKGSTTNSTSPSPAVPNPKPNTNERTEKQYKESGKFTANRSVAIRNEPNASSATVANLDPGESVTYDSVYITNKFVYISYISYSGTRRYVAIRTYHNGQRGALWGTIV